jgi:hypothetical protein
MFRQFYSMASCWNSVLTSSGDFKELIPEFYYMPEFLMNEVLSVVDYDRTTLILEKGKMVR